jgi:toxin ParE1/3/4
VAEDRPLRLRFTVRARSHLESIHAFVAERNPDAARALAARIRLALDMLTSFPDAGHPGRVYGTREWVIRGLPYVVVFEVLPERPDELVILGIFHGAQDRESPP